MWPLLAGVRRSTAGGCRTGTPQHWLLLSATQETGLRAPSLDEAQLAATPQPPALSLQGTISSKKKKQAKLKRVMGALRKNARKERGTGAESFAAVQLLNDPQVRATCCPMAGVSGL